MQFKIPKSEKYQWTRHAMYKMQQYGLSPQRVVRVIRNPERIEEGIVKNTVAVMQPASTRFVLSKRGGPSSTKIKNGKRTWSQEIWAMYKLCGKANHKSQDTKYKQIPNSKFQNPHPSAAADTFSQKEKGIKIISAWRYPGVSPKNNPIPEEILHELSEIC